LDRKELEDKSGLPHSTIRFLISRGVVPKPNGTGRGSWYEEEIHLAALLKYKQLTDEGISSIEVIRERMEAEASVNHVLEITQGLELHFKETNIPYHQFMMDPEVLLALETIKNAMERK
jgi:DNA-binding transcriptional MerR regulator